jgi:hypothetical protein
MGSPIPRPVIAQAAIVLTAVAIFTGVLTIVGSVPTSDLAEHPADPGNATATPAPGDDYAATAMPTPEPDDSLSATPAPEPDVNDMISQPDMDVRSLPVNLSGNGSETTVSFMLEPGAIAFDVWNDAPGNMEVWLMAGGEPFDLLLEYGVIAEGPLIEEVDAAGPYYLDVIADGEWRVDVSPAGPG